MDKRCGVCGVQSTLSCAKCKLRFYCGRDHQVADWKSHKLACCKEKAFLKGSLEEEEEKKKPEASKAATGNKKKAANKNKTGGGAPNKPNTNGSDPKKKGAAETVARLPQGVGYLFPTARFTDLLQFYPDGWGLSGVGLQNVGNTCFLNSCLQCLCYTRPLSLYFQGLGKHCPVGEGKDCFACDAISFFRDMMSAKAAALIPRCFVLKMPELGLRYPLPEDAQEYLGSILQELNKHFVKDTTPKLKQEETTFLAQLFSGYETSALSCRLCDTNSSNSTAPFWSLSLSCEHASLADCFDSYTQIEPVEDWMCGKCNLVGGGYRQMTILQPPRVLTIHLKRFNTMGQKINAHTSFSETLSSETLQRVMNPKASSSIVSSYSLYGVIAHYGNNINDGHYISFVKGRWGDDERWVMCDDDKLAIVPMELVARQPAYLLFYIASAPQINTNPADQAPFQWQEWPSGMKWGMQVRSMWDQVHEWSKENEKLEKLGKKNPSPAKGGAGAAASTVIKKVAPNATCPCGVGKKWKTCHGKK